MINNALSVVVVIPTYRRLSKLKRCLSSLDQQTYKNWRALVMADNNDTDTFDYCSLLSSDRVSAVIASEQIGVIKAWNKAFKCLRDNDSCDAILWSVDDVEWKPDAIANMVEVMQDYYSDLDGIVGAVQECPNSPNYDGKPYGQVMIGSKFIQRYASVDYQVCCPYYKHWFQDEELWKYATSLNKFKVAENARLIHYHPSFIKSEIDQTHAIPRDTIKVSDTDVYKRRLAKGLIWGKSWEN